MSRLKMIEHGSHRTIGTVEMEGDEHYIRFAFNAFKSKNARHFAELFDETGKLIATKGNPHSQAEGVKS